MSFVANLGAFLDMTGPENGDLAWSLASVDWPSDQQRDEFIALMSGPSPATQGAPS